MELWKELKFNLLSKTIEEYGKEKIEKEKIQNILNHPSYCEKKKNNEILRKSEKILKEIHKNQKLH